MNLYLPKQLADLVKEAAKRDRRSVSQYVQLLIERAMTPQNNQNTQCN